MPRSMSGLVQLRRNNQATAGQAPARAPSASVYLETYGCQMNVADTEVMLGMLQQAGYARADDPAAADLLLLHTCAVRERGEVRVYARASALARHKQRPGVVLG